MTLVTPPKVESNRVKALKRFGKVLAAGVVSAAAAWVIGPDAVDVVGKEYAILFGAVMTPVLSALQKILTEENVDPA